MHIVHCYEKVKMRGLFDCNSVDGYSQSLHFDHKTTSVS